jgi:hypothetical protein
MLFIVSDGKHSNTYGMPHTRQYYTFYLRKQAKKLDLCKKISLKHLPAQKQSVPAVNTGTLHSSSQAEDVQLF